MAEARCAFAILPGEGVDPARLAASVETALRHGPGDFAAVEPLDIAPAGGVTEAIEAAAAAAADYDWLLVVGTNEMLAPDIFVKCAPALRVHDAMWGGAALSSRTELPLKVERITRLAAQELPAFFHAALRWWVGQTHFVRPALAANAAAGAETYAEYLNTLWRRCSAYKTAQALTLVEETVPPMAEADISRFIEILERDPVFMPVHFGGATFQLPYTGLNPVIEREQMRGLFFEHEELAFLAGALPPHLRIVDVGANTGNHTIFFAGVMQAETVTPVEPVPRAIAAIRASIAANRLANVDASCLGTAVGAETGRLRPIPSASAGLGAMHFAPDAAGSVARVPLDGLISGRVDFMKIDVEGMEMETLAGAAGLIAAQRPVLYLEVVDTAIAAFTAWIDAHDYRIKKLFPDKTHCNYFLVPRERT